MKEAAPIMAASFIYKMLHDKKNMEGGYRVIYLGR